MPPPPRPAKTGAKPWLKGQVDDLASLAQLDEAILLEELRVRYDSDNIYTYVGDILVAINPFRALPIYTEAVQSKYQDTVKSAAPPHIFAIADQAYWALRRNGNDQCTVISGESGAGKTESAKLLIKHIIRLCHTGPEGEDLERRIIEVNPLLEAFGNAQTLMNHNSSRFGKYTELKFNAKGGVAGAQISQYLLEKSRVVNQLAGENNFHVFYYMFSSPQAGALGLSDMKAFPYTQNCARPPPDSPGMYRELIKALTEVGFSSGEQDLIHRVLGGILHLSNVSFDAVYSDTDPAQISAARDTLPRVCECFGVSEKELCEALLFTVNITRGEMIKKPYTVDKAYDGRDALAKAMYGRLFAWLVAQINELLSPGYAQTQSQQDLSEIGILDIFGFEHFDTNSFEQMCINVANEQLQNFFNQHIFKNELEEYKREGIDAAQISFVDNQVLLDLFLGKPVGVFSLLDEESNFPRATDASLVAKYKAQLGAFGNYKPARTSDPVFTIEHYAGNVTYSGAGFLEKNRDTLAHDIVGLMQGSTNDIVSTVFLEGSGATAPSSKAGGRGGGGRGGRGGGASSMSTNTAHRRAATVGAQFTKSLRVLTDKMMRCQAHFVRCIKPNTLQASRKYVPDFVNSQLRYTGMLETTRIRREGYSFRPTFQQFMERFGLLAYGPGSRVQPGRETCHRVLSVSGVGGWQIGRSKVFLKYWQVEQLDKAIRLYHSNAAVLQAMARGFMARAFRRRMRIAAREQARQAHLFFDTLSSQMGFVYTKLGTGNAEDMRRKASGRAPRAVPRPAQPPRPPKSEKELKREASILWWKEKEAPKGAGQDERGEMLPWFHGLISRGEAERLLEPRYVGCFLVRVSENRFGYTLSYRVSDRCRHYMVEQDTRGRYALVGADKVAPSLNALVDHFRRNRINEYGDMLREPCGQEIINGEEQCNYGELLPAGKRGFGGGAGTGSRPARPQVPQPGSGPGDSFAPSTLGAFSRGGPPSRPGGGGGPPPMVNRSAKPGGGGPPPMINRGAKPGTGGAPPPMINRAAKPR